MGIRFITYTHADGLVCPRPGPSGIPLGTVVLSEFEVIKIDDSRSICEHAIVSTEEPRPVVQAAVPVRSATPVQPVKALTVDQIVKQVEQRKTQRAALPQVDAPVDEATIARAKVPPKIKSDISTAPAAIQRIFDGDIEGLTASEIAELTRGPRTEVESGDGEPLNPFSNDFSASPQQSQGPVRRGNKPQSVFDR